MDEEGEVTCCDCVVGRNDGRDEEGDVRVVTVWECGGRTL